jgi:hypothetical protein
VKGKYKREKRREGREEEKERREEEEREGEITNFTKQNLESKICCGNNMSSLNPIKMKFKGLIHNEEGYKNVGEGHWLIFLQFS